MDTAAHGSNKEGGKAEAKRSLSHRISGLIHRGRTVLIAVFAALLVVLAIIAISSELRISAANAAALRMNQISDEVSAWNGETDTTKKAELEKKLITSLDQVAAKWPKLVYSQLALGIKASIAESRKDWAEAEKDWLDAASRLPTSYLAALSLANAAVAAEEQGAYDKAKEHYKALVDRYSTSFSGISHAWFAMGRIAEETKDYPAAIANYEKVAANWPNSDWTKLSKDRIISIKSRGLVK